MDGSDECVVAYPIVKIPGVDVKLGDVKFIGLVKDLDSKSTGVEVNTGAYIETYDTF